MRNAKRGQQVPWVLAGLLMATGCARPDGRYETLRARAWEEPGSATWAETRPLGSSPSPGQSEPALAGSALRLDGLIETVLARNGSLEAMRQAWREAVARYPQVISLEDPMISGMVGPKTLDRPRTEMGERLDVAYRLDLSQRVPWPGKLRLRGRSALEEAEAAGEDVETARQKLIHETKLAYFELAFVHEAEAINQRESALAQELLANARSRYETGLGSKEDALEAEIELAHVRHRSLSLDRLRKNAEARLSALLNQSPELAFPPPPPLVEIPEAESPAAEALRAVALSRRPELSALEARLRAAEADVALARKEYFPDLTLMAAYDAFWDVRELRPMIGLGFNIPIQRRRRRAAEEEAHARLERLTAELEQMRRELEAEVQLAFDQLQESRHVIHLYDAQFLPPAREALATARSNYEAGRSDRATLIEAERKLLTLELNRRQALAEYFQREADLERAVGGPIEARPSQEGD